MKIFSIRNVLGVAAVYGASQYAKKNGGWRHAAQGLLAKVREAAEQRPGAIAGAGDMSPGARSTGAATGTSAGVSSSSYTGVGSRSVGAGVRDRTSSGGVSETSGFGTGASGSGYGGSTGSTGYGGSTGSTGSTGGAGSTGSGTSGNGGGRS